MRTSVCLGEPMRPFLTLRARANGTSMNTALAKWRAGAWAVAGLVPNSPWLRRLPNPRLFRPGEGQTRAFLGGPAPAIIRAWHAFYLH
jgi:hypothetical protein